MAAESRRQLPVLVALLGVLVVVAWWQFGGAGPAAAPGAPTAAKTATRPAARAGRDARGAPETPSQVLARGVGLERLKADRPVPEAAGRDPFRAGPAPPPPDVGGGLSKVDKPLPPTTTTVNPGPPPPPPIAVKFIGIVSRKNMGKVAILSDGKNVYYGREGEIVDGRWRIVSIGEESLQIEYVDGRGRQTVRLTG